LFFALGVLRFLAGEGAEVSSTESDGFFLSCKVMEEGGMGIAGRREKACVMYGAEPALRDENVKTE